MSLPFTTDQFLDVFKTYNLFVWPAQIFLVLLALLLILALFKKNGYSDKLISFGLAVLWLWMGIVYHYKFFTKINNAAYIFGTLFVIQAGLFLFFGVVKSKLIFNYKNDLTVIISILFFIYALIFYPLLGYQLGHIYPGTPTFGLPCPTTIFTFGFILLLEQRKIIIFIIPVLWSIIGFTAALKLGIYQDIGLLIAGIISVIILFSKK
ncbi:MAG TPA: hypothetical protein DHV28_09005 [Ignavibacteriales bacterium]|nr:hypothetical protein [Ignavibacteriales bacterium]